MPHRPVAIEDHSETVFQDRLLKAKSNLLPSAIQLDEISGRLKPTSSRLALDALATIGYYHSRSESHPPQNFVDLVRKIWPKICAWVTLFIRGVVVAIPDDIGLTTPGSFASYIREKTIWIISNVLRTGSDPNFGYIVYSVHESVISSDPSFVPALLQLSVHLASERHPALSWLWMATLALMRRDVTPQPNQFDTSRTNLLYSPDSPYDFCKIATRLLTERIYEDQFDSSAMLDELLFLEALLPNDGPMSHTANQVTGNLIRKHIIANLTRAVALLVRVSPLFPRTRVGSYINEVLEAHEGCLILTVRFLGTFIGVGMTWANEALDENLLVHLTRLPLRLSR
ncbi:hypothetical protein L218DRAFT_1008749 [Marasmius fiardii PR-910]|nr:hypothetical protein L218DRAFT_1008749 [Marasmius fiardii PR-910]